MTLFTTNDTDQPACTTNVHRPRGAIVGLREIHDDVGRLMVSVFPTSLIREMSPVRANVAACYILADSGNCYIGETSNVGRRLSEHLRDPQKSFAREVYVVTGLEGAWFDSTTAIYLQFRFTQLAEQAGLVDVIKGVNPQVLTLPNHRRASLDIFAEYAERLLYDGGCRVLRSNFTPQRGHSSEASVALDETEPMDIGVSATPIGAELELGYTGLWARGFNTPDGAFVVTAGSEVRSVINASAQPIVAARRAELDEAEALIPIPGIADRQRLRVAVRFASAAIAAKVLSGAHVDSSKWQPPRDGRAILIAT